MFWQIPLMGKIIAAYIFWPILQKQLLKDIKEKTYLRTYLLLIQYLLCVFFSVIFLGCAFLLGFGEFRFGFPVMMMAILGIANSVAVYCQWRAMDISLSRTAILTQFDDFIAIALGYFLLDEHRFLTFGVGTGFCLCSFTAFLFMCPELRQRKNLQKSVIFRVAVYSIIWGVNGYFDRKYALGGMAFSEFLVSWYGGSFVGSIIILAVGLFSGQVPKVSIKEIRETAILMPLIASMVWFARLLGYWTVILAPIIASQPIFFVSEAVFPSLIGLYYFKEKDNLTMYEKVAFLTGILGSIIIGLSFAAK